MKRLERKRILIDQALEHWLPVGFTALACVGGAALLKEVSLGESFATVEPHPASSLFVSSLGLQLNSLALISSSGISFSLLDALSPCSDEIVVP